MRVIFTNILYWKIWKNGQNRVLSPLKGRFYANFIPNPIGHDLRGYLGQFLNVEIFTLWNGGSSNMQKWSFLTILATRTA